VGSVAGVALLVLAAIAFPARSVLGALLLGFCAGFMLVRARFVSGVGALRAGLLIFLVMAGECTPGETYCEQRGQ